jgi:hypothetical protein
VEGSIFHSKYCRKVQNLGKIAVKNCRGFLPVKKICEKPPKSFWYHLTEAGNTFPNNPFWGGTPCREK